MSNLILENVSYSIHEKKQVNQILNDISLTFPEGRVNIILGESGCGKTTLLRCIAGLNDKYTGNIYLDKTCIDQMPVSERKMAYVTQTFALYPHMTIFDSIAYPLKLEGCQSDEIKERVFSLAKKLDILPILTRKPKQVSLGQMQRAAIARAIIKLPNVCLLDEPLSNLDILVSAKVRRLIKNVLKEISSTVIYVTHDIDEATSIGDNVFVMENGSFIFKGTVNEFIKCKDKRILKYFQK